MPQLAGKSDEELAALVADGSELSCRALEALGEIEERLDSLRAEVARLKAALSGNHFMLTQSDGSGE